MAAEINM
ncbi:hypothetical protein DDB_G0294182, partial [Dictyostelium discoideum AX4]